LIFKLIELRVVRDLLLEEKGVAWFWTSQFGWLFCFYWKATWLKILLVPAVGYSIVWILSFTDLRCMVHWESWWKCFHWRGVAHIFPWYLRLLKIHWRPLNCPFLLYISLLKCKLVLRAALRSKPEIVLAYSGVYEAVLIGLFILGVKIFIICKVSVGDITHILFTHFNEFIISNVFLIYFIYIVCIINLCLDPSILWLF